MARSSSLETPTKQSPSALTADQPCLTIGQPDLTDVTRQVRQPAPLNRWLRNKRVDQLDLIANQPGLTDDCRTVMPTIPPRQPTDQPGLTDRDLPGTPSEGDHPFDS
ncbi:hypothetical protein BHM03_00010834 [Ensete ventricosum]|nr:hypothetical protein BHM03_00010834 [Ensete ventricosum]